MYVRMCVHVRAPYEAGRVVVAERLGVSERFQDRIGLDDLLFNPLVRLA
jgi:hypothetical protein